MWAFGGGKGGNCELPTLIIVGSVIPCEIRFFIVSLSYIFIFIVSELSLVGCGYSVVENRETPTLYVANVYGYI